MVPTDSFDRETGIDMLNVNGGISDGAQYAIRKLLWALIIAVVLEIAWFNFPFWESLTFGPEQQVELNTGSGLTETSAGTYRIDNVDQAYFELTPVVSMLITLSSTYLSRMGSEFMARRPRSVYYHARFRNRFIEHGVYRSSVIYVLSRVIRFPLEAPSSLRRIRYCSDISQRV